MSTDPLDGMTSDQVADAVDGILEVKRALRDYEYIGLMIMKLQDWGCFFNYSQFEKSWQISCPRRTISQKFSDIKNSSLVNGFLHTAHALGHWTPPQKQLTIEEKVEVLWNNHQCKPQGASSLT